MNTSIDREFYDLVLADRICHEVGELPEEQFEWLNENVPDWNQRVSPDEYKYAATCADRAVQAALYARGMKLHPIAFQSGHSWGRIVSGLRRPSLSECESRRGSAFGLV